jgi:eukaryotic-like serine/threonine-protein kinase
LTVESDPPGADVYVKLFRQPNMEWRHLGKTPLADVRLPVALLRWRVEKPGFAPLDVQRPITGRKVTLTLRPDSTVPAEMVWVKGGTVPSNSTGLRGVSLPDYFIDRFEVTNRQFKQFVDAGGYATPEWWRQPFVRAGRTLDYAAAMAEFRDGTGQPGPASWKNGTFPDGAAELPVTGVSWFEAAAYAEWAGKRLPSVYHWRHAGRALDDNASIVPLSNFAGKGVAPGGTFQGVSACGAYDMAGNVKEWCWNEAEADVRYLLGGAWREPDYMFVQSDALSPFDRSDANGFRCIKYVETEASPAASDAPVPRQARDYAHERPVSDEVFNAFRSLYSYDKGPLDARAESVEDGDPRWRKERVSYRAAYGDERVPAYLFLPKNATPPYQTVVFFPGAGARQVTSSANLRETDRVTMLVGSGRALIFPIYKGTYERTVPELRGTPPFTTAAYRDWVITLAKDLRRSIDYVETRPDLDVTKLAYVGSSWGGALGALLPAVEPRIKANILIIGGFFETKPFPEVDQINFAPRITVPTLMLGGRYDFRFPLETSQRPMFRLLGTPTEHKRHVLFDTGHALKAEQIASATYAWLDQYLGLVK